MKKIIRSFFLILLTANLSGKNFVAYKTSGRLGDCLLCYLHAKWISHKYNLPLQLVYFKHSNYFIFDPTDSTSNIPFSKTKSIVDSTPLNLSANNNTKFLVPYFPENADEREQYRRLGRPRPYFKVDWGDAEFKMKINTLTHSKIPVQIVEAKRNSVNVAIHIRDGSGKDSSKTRKFFAAKFPSMEFYKTALNEVTDLLQNKKIYCHIFTDRINRISLVDDLKKEFADFSNIEFDFRNNSDVMDDFFSFFNFDIIIRPDSNFSLVPTLIKDFAIVASPKTRLEDKTMIVEKGCNIEVNPNLFQILVNNKQTDIML